MPLDTTLRIPKDATLAHWLSREPGRQRDEINAERETRPVSALEALGEHRELTVLGKPGSGKSTFGASVLLMLAQAWQGQGDELAKLGETWAHGALLPIRVVLRRFAEQLSPGDKAARAGDVWAFIARDLDASGYGLSTDAMKYVQRIARNDGAFIVLDGLDECGQSASRERVLGAVHELMQSAGPKCRFVLTARPYAWPGGLDPAQGVYALADFNDDQIERFIRAWYAALVKRKWRSPGEAERKLDDLLDARHRSDLLPLAENPLLLTLMATLHTNRGRLPDDRADLYNESVDLLMLRWNRQIGADKALLDELAIPSLKRKADAKRVAGIIGARVNDDEINDALTPTPEFYIARYPVTIAQFRAFVEATGFEIGDADALRGRGGRPVRWVSWHEARAYCDWLHEMLATWPALEGFAVGSLVRDGRWRIALPSELEWEKAARGDLPDAVFSWGDRPDPNCANYADSRIGDTSAVGCFPANGSRLQDMIGNVWEWTRSLWVAYPYDPDDRKREDIEAKKVTPVVRGGSWSGGRDYARCAFRRGARPGGRDDHLGFRVVLRSAPVPWL